MAGLVKYIYGTEAQILSLVEGDANWIDRAFYYPSDKTYFFQVDNGVMKKYGAGVFQGVGVTLNGFIVGGIKELIEAEEVLNIPNNYAYNSYYLTVEGSVDCSGTINIK